MEVSDHDQGQIGFRKLKTPIPTSAETMLATSQAGKGDKADKTRNVLTDTSGNFYWCQATEVTMSARVTVLPTQMMETKITMVNRNSMVLLLTN